MKEDGLPEDVLSEIFLRLPTKSICKFRCISKVWLHNLSDTNLMRKKFKTIEDKPWAILSNNHMSAQSISSCREISGFDGFSFSFLTESYSIDAEYHKLYILASGNGLVLCSVVNYCNDSWIGRRLYFVCNPITKESVPLPPPPKDSVGEFSYCLVCDTNSDSPAIACESAFKVVRTETCLRSNIGFEVDIYFSDLDEWRTYNVAYPRPRDEAGGKESIISNVITHNGVVYWIEEYPVGYNDINRVVAYDLKINNYECYSHQCDVIVMPFFLFLHPRQPASSERLGVSGDFVYYGHIRKNVLRTWVLNMNRWEERYAITLPDIDPRNFSFNPTLMAFSPMDRDVVILSSGDQIFRSAAEEPEINLCLCLPSSENSSNHHGNSEFLHRICVPSSKNSFKTRRGYSPIIVTPTLTTISKARR